MKKGIVSAVFLFLCSLTIYAQDKPTLSNVGNENPNQASFKFNEDEFSFGNIMQGEKVTHEFEFTNAGKEPLVITSAAGSCGCTVPVWPKEPIMGGAKAKISVTFDSAGKQGVQDKTITLQSNAKQNPMVLHLKGNVDKPIEQPGANPANPLKK